MRYFLAALATGPTALPKLPVLALATMGFIGLAIFSMPYWAAAALVPLGLAAMLGSNPRFQKTVDARRFQTSSAPAGEDEYTQICSKIKVETLSHLRILERKGKKIIAAQRESGTDEFTLDANDDAIKQLLLIYAKIVLARQQLLTEDFAASIARTQGEIASVQNNLQDSTATDAERTSLSATLQLLQSRLHSLTERQQKLEELNSDLKRIEAHFDLALSQASMRDRPQSIATDIGLASSGLSGGVPHGGMMPDVPMTPHRNTSPSAGQSTEI